MSALKEEVITSLRRMQSELEELWQTIEQEPSIGDDGVAEQLVSIDNTLTLVVGRLSKGSWKGEING